MSWGFACVKFKRVVLKKIPETDAIFTQLARLHEAAADNDQVLRLSMDAKARIPVGFFSRGGQSRVVVKALDHDFAPDEVLIPFGIFLPDHDALYLYFTASRLTSDFIVDCLTDCWQTIQDHFPQVTTLLINQDNGSECHSHRTQFMARIALFADQFNLGLQLAYYPPYHSKYNPIERVWGILEKHWNGSILDSAHTVLEFAKSLTWKGHTLTT